MKLSTLLTYQCLKNNISYKILKTSISNYKKEYFLRVLIVTKICINVFCASKYVFIV